MPPFISFPRLLFLRLYIYIYVMLLLYFISHEVTSSPQVSGEIDSPMQIPHHPSPKSQRAFIRTTNCQLYLSHVSVSHDFSWCSITSSNVRNAYYRKQLYERCYKSHHRVCSRGKVYGVQDLFRCTKF